MSPNGIFRALQHTWLTLEPLDIPMAVMGGIALATWKHVRATKDVDLLIGAGPHEPKELVEILAVAGIRRKRSSATIRLGQLELIEFLYEPPETFLDLEIDVLLASGEYHQSALARRVPVKLPGLEIEVAVLTCEDLILHKLLAGRMIDLADSAALLKANRQTLDFNYLVDWAQRTDLVSALHQAWHDAWPNAPMPLEPTTET